MCRDGEGGVKGHDREAAANPPLTPPASAILHLSGECQQDLSSGLPVQRQFRFHKIENFTAPTVHWKDSLRFCVLLCSIDSFLLRWFHPHNAWDCASARSWVSSGETLISKSARSLFSAALCRAEWMRSRRNTQRPMFRLCSARGGSAGLACTDDLSERRRLALRQSHYGETVSPGRPSTAHPETGWDSRRDRR